MRVKIVAFASDDSGATAIEYGLIAALIAVGCIVAATLFGNSLLEMFNMVRDRAGGSMDSAGLPATEEA
jgi:pilus assembly protein Flp/PilA